MTKEDILHHFQDINFYYNDCMMYDDLSRMLDELIAENKTQMIDKSNFDIEQYKADLQSAYDCGYNKALSESKGEWIPVSERLPENNEDVLVYDSEIFVAWYSGIEGNWCSADRRLDEYTPIIAWQPLPEPYKAESEVKPNETDN